MRFLQLFAVVLAFSFVPAKSGYWLQAHATFYGGADGSDTMGKLCSHSSLNSGLLPHHQNMPNTIYLQNLIVLLWLFVTSKVLLNGIQYKCPVKL